MSAYTIAVYILAVDRDITVDTDTILGERSFYCSTRRAIVMVKSTSRYLAMADSPSQPCVPSRYRPPRLAAPARSGRCCVPL